MTARATATTLSTKDAATAFGVARTRGPRKMQAFRRRAAMLLAGLRALHPDTRDCDLAEIAAAAIDDGGRLLQACGRDFLKAVLREELAPPAPRNSAGPSSSHG